MQPYIFPYIGYFQLIAAADKFVFYDDVNFIKQGWINRNRILSNGAAVFFTVPLSNQSSFTKIREIKVNVQQYTKWKSKFFKSISGFYSKAPNHKKVLELISEIFVDAPTDIVDMAVKSVTLVCDYLSIPTTIVKSSAIYNNNNLKGQDRIIDICRIEGASTYLNMIGGSELYSPVDFNAHGVQLQFLKSRSPQYLQQGKTFVPNLSIIDVLMFNGAQEVQEFVKNYELI